MRNKDVFTTETDKVLVPTWLLYPPHRHTPPTTAPLMTLTGSNYFFHLFISTCKREFLSWVSFPGEEFPYTVSKQSHRGSLTGALSPLQLPARSPLPPRHGCHPWGPILLTGLGLAELAPLKRSVASPEKKSSHSVSSA